MTQTCGGSETLTQSFTGTGGSRNADGQVTADSETYTGSCSGQANYQRNYSYDIAGRVTYQGSTPQGAQPDTFAYDPAGDVTTLSSHDGTGSFNTYTQAYDNTGATTSQTPTPGSGGVASTFGYDILGDQTSATAGSSTTTYGYDQAGHMANVAGPSSSASYQYNGDGLEVAATSPKTVWAPASDVDAARALKGVSCPSSSFCAAVDGSGYAQTFDGANWSTATDIDGTNALAAVSCPSASLCVAVDGKGNVLTYNGTSWSTASNKDSTRALKAVSCPSSSFCAAVDGTGYALTYNGTSWSTPTDIDGTNAINGVSCPSASFCVAVDGKGNVLTYNGTSWSAASNKDSTRSLKAVSCSSSSFCAAVDASGYALTYNGSSWSTATNVDSTRSINAVSCVSSSYCQAVDGSGYALTYTGSGWSAAQDIDAARALAAVSCPTTTFCATNDGSAYASLYHLPLSVVQVTWDGVSGLPRIVSDGSRDYIDGPSGTPVESIDLSTSAALYMTYTAGDSAWLTTNSAGNQTGFWRYDAFGTLAYGTPTASFGYAGEYRDATSGYANLRARWYAPQAGAFTTRDPDFAQTDSAYVYATGDPVNNSDPTGLVTCAPNQNGGGCADGEPLPPGVDNLQQLYATWHAQDVAWQCAQDQENALFAAINQWLNEYNSAQSLSARVAAETRRVESEDPYARLKIAIKIFTYVKQCVPNAIEYGAAGVVVGFEAGGPGGAAVVGAAGAVGGCAYGLIKGNLPPDPVSLP